MPISQDAAEMLLFDIQVRLNQFKQEQNLFFRFSEDCYCNPDYQGIFFFTRILINWFFLEHILIV